MVAETWEKTAAAARRTEEARMMDRLWKEVGS